MFRIKFSVAVTQFITAAVGAAVLLSGSVLADEVKPSFSDYSLALKAEAKEKGYSNDLLEQVFSSLTFHERIVSADKSQPEFVETLETYLPKRVSDIRIAMARERYVKYLPELTKIGNKYGVQPRFIVALWGLESSFGRLMGNYSVPSALATLAYEGRREAFFKKEFFHALDILAAGHISFADMKGSWAGAMGQSQFMPSSFMAYAQDGDGDGKMDIWTNQLDVFASIANYLKQQGWDNDKTWGRQVLLPAGFDPAHAIAKGSLQRGEWLKRWQQSERSLSEWQALGVKRMNGTDLPQRDIKAALIFPDGENGQAYLAYDNYKVLMHWNKSYYFVTSVGYLADLIVAKDAN